MDFFIVIGLFALFALAMVQQRRNAARDMSKMDDRVSFDDWETAELKEVEEDPNAVPVRFD